MLGTFNNRELAMATLVALFFICVLRKASVREAMSNVLSAFFQRAILFHLSLLSLYVIFVIYHLSRIEIWNLGQVKNTLVWFIFVGSAQLFNTTKIQEPKDFLISSLNKQFKLLVLIQFVVAFHTYSFITELALVSILTLLGCCSLVAASEPNHIQVKRILDMIIGIAGIILLIDSIAYIFEVHRKFFSINTFRDYLVPLLLSVSTLPYIYCLYYYFEFEKAFTKTRIYTDSPTLRRYAKFWSFIKLKGNHQHINDWLAYSCIPEFENKQTILDSIERYKNKVKK